MYNLETKPSLSACQNQNLSCPPPFSLLTSLEMGKEKDAVIGASPQLHSRQRLKKKIPKPEGPACPVPHLR